MNDKGKVAVGDLGTNPQCTNWRVGNEANHIWFDFLVLPDGQVTVDSYLVFSDQQVDETFLYEIVDRSEAMHAASTLVEDAVKYLEEGDAGELTWRTCPEFLAKLEAELQAQVH